MIRRQQLEYAGARQCRTCARTAAGHACATSTWGTSTRRTAMLSYAPAANRNTDSGRQCALQLSNASPRCPGWTARASTRIRRQVQPSAARARCLGERPQAFSTHARAHTLACTHELAGTLARIVCAPLHARAHARMHAHCARARQCSSFKMGSAQVLHGSQNCKRQPKLPAPLIRA